MLTPSQELRTRFECETDFLGPFMLAKLQSQTNSGRQNTSNVYKFSFPIQSTNL